MKIAIVLMLLLTACATPERASVECTKEDKSLCIPAAANDTPAWLLDLVVLLAH
jgi:hypothetical protein